MEYDVDLKVTADGRAAARAVNKVEKEIKDVEKQSEKTTRKIKRNSDSIARSFARAGAAASAISVPLVAIGLQSAKVAGEFGSSMTKINTLVGISVEEVRAMKEEVLGLTSTGIAPRELAEGLFAITSAGLRGADAMDALENSANAASIGLGDTRSVALAVSAAMTAYGSETLNAKTATEILVGTVEQGNLAAEELASSVGQVIGIAAEMGIKFEEVGAFIATFTRLGVNASEATTALRSTISSILKPTTEQEEAFEKLGFSVDAFRQKVEDEGFISSFRELVNRAEEFDINIADLIPNVRALSGVLGVFGQEGNAAEGVLEGVSAAVGTLEDRVARAMELDPTQRLKVIKGELEALQIQIGTVLLPIIVDFADSLSDLVQSFLELEASTQKAIVKTTSFVAAVGPLLLISAVLVKSVGVLAPAIVAVATGVGSMATAVFGASGGLASMIALEKAMGATTTATALYSLSMKRLIPLLGRAGIIGAMILAANETRKFHNKLEEGIDYSDQFLEAMQRIRGEFDKEPGQRFAESMNDILLDVRNEAERLEEVLKRLQLNRTSFSPIAERTGGLAPGTSAAEREAASNLETVREIERFVQQAAGVKEFEDISNAITLLKTVSDLATPSLVALGETFGFIKREVEEPIEVKVETEVDKPIKRLEEIDAAIDSMRKNLAGPAELAVLNFNSAMEQLNTQFDLGKVPIGQYNEFVELLAQVLQRDLNAALEESAELEREVAEAAEEAAEEAAKATQDFYDFEGALSLSAVKASLAEEELFALERELFVLETVTRGVTLAQEAGIEVTDEMIDRWRELAIAANKAREESEGLGGAINQIGNNFARSILNGQGIQDSLTSSLIAFGGQGIGSALDQTDMAEFFKTAFKDGIGAAFKDSEFQKNSATGYALALGQAMEGNFGQAALTAAGNAFGGEIGALIGSILGDALFGDSKPKFQVRGTLSNTADDAGTDRVISTAFGVDLELAFRGIEDTAKRQIVRGYSEFLTLISGVVRDPDQQSAIAGVISRFGVSSRSGPSDIEGQLELLFADILGTFDSFTQGFVKQAETLDGQVQRLDDILTLSNLDALGRNLGLTFEELATVLDDLAVGGESIIQTFSRLESVIASLDVASALTGNSLAESREGLVRFGADLAALFGDDANALSAKLDRALGAIFSETEISEQQVASSRQKLSDLLTSLGVQVTEEAFTQEGFRDIFESLFGNLSAEDTAILIEAGSVFADLIAAEEELARIRGDAADGLAEDFQRAVDSIARALDSQLIGPASSLTPQERLNEAESQLRQAVIDAQAGDLQAARDIPALFNQAIGIGAGFFGTATEGFVAFESDLRSLLEGLELGPEGASVADAQLSQLESINDIAQQQLESLQTIALGVTGGFGFDTGAYIESDQLVKANQGESVVPVNDNSFTSNSSDNQMIQKLSAIESKIAQGNEDRRVAVQAQVDELAEIVEQLRQQTRRGARSEIMRPETSASRPSVVRGRNT